MSKRRYKPLYRTRSFKRHAFSLEALLASMFHPVYHLCIRLAHSTEDLLVPFHMSVGLGLTMVV